MLLCPPMPPGPLAVLALLALAGAPTAPPAELCPSEVNKIKDLLQLSCVGQELTRVPPGLPKDTGILLLASNRLGQVSTASFQHLGRLAELDLSHNGLAALETGPLLPNLRELILAHNALKSLPALQGFPQLRRLALGHNALSQLPEGGFRALSHLQDLELEGNRLQHLPPGAFQGLAELRDLDLSGNGLEELPQGLLAGLPKLDTLRLERNRLQALPDGFFPEETLFAYVYLEGNPWLCDCRLEYLREWVTDNEGSIYTREPVGEKEVTRGDPQSVRCQAPGKEKGHPVMDFETFCSRELGDGGGLDVSADPGGGSAPLPGSTAGASTPAMPPSSPCPPTSTAALSTPASASPTHPLTTTSATPAATSTAPWPPSRGFPSTWPAAATTSMGPTTFSNITPSAPTVSSPTPNVNGHTTTSLAPAEASTPAPTALLRNTTAPPDTWSPSTRAPQSPPPPSRAPHSTLTPPAPSSASTTGSSSASSLPAPQPPAHCLCPVLPVSALRVASRRQSPLSWAGWLATRCCPLRLALYVACLLLVALPTLAVLCWLGWMYVGWYRPATQGAPGVQLVRCQQVRCCEEQRLLPGPRLYRVCKRFKVAPLRHVTWLLISLPGPARRWPWERSQGNVSSYSLDRGRDVLGAVRVKYAASTL